MNYLCNGKKNEVLIHAMTQINLKTCSKEKPDTRGHILCDSVYKKCPEQINPSRQKAHSWLAGLGNDGTARDH